MLDELIERSKKILTLAADMSKTYYGKPLIITYSGGKDSDVLLHLAESCLKPDEFEVLNSHTTVDAPETVYHIRETFERLRGGVLRQRPDSTAIPKSQETDIPSTERALTERWLLCGI